MQEEFEAAEVPGNRARSSFGIFVSYRQTDSTPWVGRLVEDLRDYFGPDRVYRYTDSNRSAQDYVRQIIEALSSADAVIAVLGRQWLHAVDEKGRRRLDDPDDLVRLELETALRKGTTLVPVLVDGATMPAEHELPESLRSLSRSQGISLTDRHWKHDFHQLLHALDNHGVLPSRSPRVEEPTALKKQLTDVRRFERTLPALPRQTFSKLVSAVQQLRYPQLRVDREAAEVVFTVLGKEVRAAVVDGTAGNSTLKVSFTSVRGRFFAAGTALALATNPMLGLTWPAIRAWERRFATGFIDNVERLLDGRGIGPDSALPPGVQSWRERRWKV
ncbi:toll/interleukin-1 receptor domain-containing protein [Actinokineospora sp. UTMC 2448]|uniref:toll/interleukin-1 receptor domain-containing protein n=1 Tax=Actinokineospora sp. UTMC 2448 TaxID=2268449 RepID=UPI002164B57C|nr:toll/interleukin-1 receptor domain-containing protein [Actinokineospora sp. UTMC 2448]UVS81365.1 hypothetical protein Actkin_05122 [Actinokineospora sp. UTMC 2448]